MCLSLARFDQNVWLPPFLNSDVVIKIALCYTHLFVAPVRMCHLHLHAYLYQRTHHHVKIFISSSNPHSLTFTGDITKAKSHNRCDVFEANRLSNFTFQPFDILNHDTK
jgi:hypothetical protein